MPRYPLPKDTRATFGEWPPASANQGLIFERYLPLIEGRTDERNELKKQALKAVLKCEADLQLLRAHLARWEAIACFLGAKPFVATTQWRFITGLGRKGALEIGFHFHPLYGFPVIPGSGLKGLARSWAFPDEKSLEFLAVFGRGRRRGEPESAGRAGGAVFLDAVPDRPVKLDLDVINPHYPDYYRPKDRQLPANWQSPVPVLFLAIPADTPFHFAVGWRGPENRPARELAVEWLKAGLSELGAGAKTTAGYGYWDVPAQQPGEGSEPSPGSPLQGSTDL